MKNIFIIIGLFFLGGCTEKLAELLFDETSISRVSKYSYTYKDGKKIKMIDSTFNCVYQKNIDTSVTITDYIYNSKGLLQKEIACSLPESSKTYLYYSYFDNDSLMEIIGINSEGDTNRITRYQNYKYENKIVYDRHLFIHIDEDKSIEEILNNITYDTIGHMTEYAFRGRMCISSKTKNIENEETDSFVNEYQDDKLIKKSCYTKKKGILANIDITTYDYSKSNKYPDYVTLNYFKDTIVFEKNEFDGNKLKSREYHLVKEKRFHKDFFENGKMIATVLYDIENRQKITNTYNYNDKGDMFESKNYIEKLTNSNTH